MPRVPKTCFRSSQGRIPPQERNTVVRSISPSESPTAVVDTCGVRTDSGLSKIGVGDAEESLDITGDSGDCTCGFSLYRCASTNGLIRRPRTIRVRLHNVAESGNHRALGFALGNIQEVVEQRGKKSRKFQRD